MHAAIYFICLILLTASASSYAQEKVVSISTLEDYAPYCMTVGSFQSNQIIQVGDDASGFQGYSWDVLRESFHQMGYTIHLSITPWSRAMVYTKTGQTDILFPTSKTLSRQKEFFYSDESINDKNVVIYVRSDNQIEWKGIESLKGLIIGVKRGFTYGDKWKAATDIEKYPVKTILQGFSMLNMKRIDGFIGYELNWDYALKKKHWDTKFRKLTVFDRSGEYLVALKTNPKAKQILKAFDMGKNELSKSGRLKAIKKKWFGSNKKFNKTINKD